MAEIHHHHWHLYIFPLHSGLFLRRGLSMWTSLSVSTQQRQRKVFALERHWTSKLYPCRLERHNGLDLRLIANARHS